MDLYIITDYIFIIQFQTKKQSINMGCCESNTTYVVAEPVAQKPKKQVRKQVKKKKRKVKKPDLSHSSYDYNTCGSNSVGSDI